MKNYFVIPLVLLLAITNMVLAQNDFRPGFIITLNNDTLKGLLQYKGSISSARKCGFKASEDAEQVHYSPTEIKSYRFQDGKYYVSRNVSIEGKVDTLFLEYLIDGIVDIYYYRDGQDKENYLVDPGDGNFIVLDDSARVFIRNGSRYECDAKRYIGILKYIFRASPDVSQEVERIKLDHRSLIRVARQYHNEVCKDRECVVFEKKVVKVKFVANVLVGVNLNQIHVISDQAGNNLFENCDFNSALYPTAGLNFSISLPDLNERLSLHYEAAIGKRHLNAAYTYSFQGVITPDYYTVINNVNFSQLLLNNTLALQYEIPFGNWNGLIRTGLSYRYFFNTDFWHQFKVIGGGGYEDIVTRSPFRNDDGGICLGFGASWKLQKEHKLKLEYDFRYGRGIYFSFHDLNHTIKLSLQLGK
ncbi:MAG: hypothetical protein HXX13_01520 [Bacteroidetes bacterium]|nr:hypothetical protein [Bacteroidota bacterium]